MKCIAAIVLFALVAIVTIAQAKPTSITKLEEPIEPSAQAEAIVPETARNKRGLLFSSAYTVPVTYNAYSAPVAYTASAYSYPAYTRSAYTSYPYSYYAPYYLA